ncbi:hypothetical protein ABPG74_004095 [Tetrahymena malaccensis]
MFSYINNILEDRRINKRTLAFGISFVLAAFAITKSSLVQRLKDRIMGSKVSCCQNDKVQEIAKVDDQVKVETRGTLNVVYGTTGGNSARLAANLIAEAKKHKYQPKLIHLGDFDATNFTNMDRAIFVISTYGVGGPTSDAQVFYEWISQQEDPKLLSHMKYTVFGLGNSTFENFAGFGVKIDSKLEQLGAKRLYPLGKGDAAEDTTDQDFNKWKDNIWNVLNEEFQLQETTLRELRKAEAGFELKIVQGASELDFDHYTFEEQKIESKLREYFNATNVPVKEIRELRQKPDESSCLHIDFDISSTGFKYDTAGNLGVYPENDQKSIQDFATLQGYSLEDVFVLEPSQERTKLPLPSPMKVSTFLSKFCDLFGPVNKTILQGLAELSGNQQFIIDCEKWVSDSQGFEENIREKNHSIFSLSKQYKIRIPLLSLIKISNRIFPRFYTISSSNLSNPKDLHMCISISKVKDPSGTRNGQASSFFTALKSNYQGKKVRIFHQESTFKLPQDKEKPIIMVGPGAGLAPFRAFLQEKQFLEDSKQNTKFGESVLYFGCRGKKVDYIYKNDLESFEKSKICNQLRLAFSRDGPNKVYVQDLMQQDLEQIADLFLNKQGTIYVCGSKAVGESVKEFIINMYQEKEGLVPYLAYSKIAELESEKRVIMEVWG